MQSFGLSAMIGSRMKSSVVDLVVTAAVAGSLMNLVEAQTGNFDQNQFNFGQFNPPVTSIMIAIVAAVFFIAVCSIYLRRCNQDPRSVGGSIRGLSMRARRTVVARGLDSEIIENLPTFSYSEVKGHKIGKGGLECAVCLNEFEEGDTLRLLPHCDHVFHPDCIGAWLAHHTSCPVCRADLTQPAAFQLPENNRIGSRKGEIILAIDGNQTAGASSSSNIEAQTAWPNFRSHSTGHSLVNLGESLDRFTLRLPEGMKKEVIKRSMLNRARSYAVGEGSVPRFRSVQKLTASKSERWAIFKRALSMKSPTARVASFKCLETKASASVNDGITRATLV